MILHTGPGTEGGSYVGELAPYGGWLTARVEVRVQALLPHHRKIWRIAKVFRSALWGNQIALLASPAAPWQRQRSKHKMNLSDRPNTTGACNM